MDCPLDVGAVGVWGGLVCGIDQTRLMQGAVHGTPIPPDNCPLQGAGLEFGIAWLAPLDPPVRNSRGFFLLGSHLERMVREPQLQAGSPNSIIPSKRW
jgi:hypothetical protein